MVLKKYMSYSILLRLIVLILLILLILFDFIHVVFGLAWDFTSTQEDVDIILTNTERIISLCNIIIYILIIIWMFMQNNIKIYYCNEKTYKFVSRVNGSIIFVIMYFISFSLFIISNHLSYYNKNKILYDYIELIIIILMLMFDVIYRYQYHNKSKKEYMNGNVYKYVKQFSTIYVYKYNPEINNENIVDSFQYKNSISDIFFTWIGWMCVITGPTLLLCYIIFAILNKFVTRTSIMV